MKPNQSTHLKWLIRALASLFTFLGTLKFVAISGETTLMTTASPVINFLTYRQMILLAALLETGVGIYGLLTNSTVLALAALSWATSLLVGYRILLHWTGVSLPCSCLGPSAVWFGWTAPFERLVTGWLLVSMVLVCALGWFLSRNNRPIDR